MNESKNQVDGKKIVVSLKKKKLYLMGEDGSKVKEYPVIYGRNSSEGNKEREGDQRTPIGNFYICTINEQSQFSLFFGLSYPGDIDGVKGYAKGLISIEELKEIFLSQKFKQRPPWNTKLGGEVGIHGGGINREGTKGCIAMRDEDVIDLGKHVYYGMDVVIN